MREKRFGERGVEKRVDGCRRPAPGQCFCHNPLFSVTPARLTLTRAHHPTTSTHKPVCCCFHRAHTLVRPWPTPRARARHKKTMVLAAHRMRPFGALAGSRARLPAAVTRPGHSSVRPFLGTPTAWSSQAPLASWESAQGPANRAAPPFATDRRTDAAAWDAVDTLSTLGAVAGAVGFVLTQEVRDRQGRKRRGRRAEAS